jgi:hypothetical protein
MLRKRHGRGRATQATFPTEEDWDTEDGGSDGRNKVTKAGRPTKELTEDVAGSGRGEQAKLATKTKVDPAKNGQGTTTRWRTLVQTVLNDLWALVTGFWSFFALILSLAHHFSAWLRLLLGPLLTLTQLFPGALRPTLAYFIWMWFSYASSYGYHRGWDTLSAWVCPVPALGPRFGFCNATVSPSTPLNLSKMTSSQDDLIVVRDALEQNQNLMELMLDNQFAVRDLKIRVAASKLPRKKDLAEDLETLIVLTREASR